MVSEQWPASIRYQIELMISLRSTRWLPSSIYRLIKRSSFHERNHFQNQSQNRLSSGHQRMWHEIQALEEIIPMQVRRNIWVALMPMATTHFLSKWVRDVEILPLETVPVSSPNIKTLRGEEMPRTGCETHRLRVSQPDQPQHPERSSCTLDPVRTPSMVMSVSCEKLKQITSSWQIWTIADTMRSRHEENDGTIERLSDIFM